jgi:hypothetical protein
MPRRPSRAVLTLDYVEHRARQMLKTIIEREAGAGRSECGVPA